MQAVLDWLGALPPVALYLAIFAAAAVENFFPPAPSDIVIAFASFLAARGGDSPIPAFVAVLVGNMGGATAMYALGRRFGAGLIERRLGGSKEAQRRVAEWYDHYGIGALFVSRFLPGLRAIVPPLAGALKVPAVGAIAAMAVASAIWYGIITVLAFRAGSDWSALQATITRYGRWITIVATLIVLIGVAIWLVRRRASARQ